MSDDRKRRVRERAHELWQRDGRPEGRHLDHWYEAEREIAGDPDDARNEGEGNKTAARQYNRKARQFAESGRVEKKAREAREARDGPEGKTLKDAEKAGKRRSRGEDPALVKK